MEVVCFITYKNDSTSIKHFQQLQNDLKNNIDVDVYLLYNNSNEKLHNELYEANNVYEFNKQIVEQNGFEFHYYYWINKGDFYGHNNELIWLNFYKTHKNYNKYWFIDYDILYTGNPISESLERRKLYVSYCKAAGQTSIKGRLPHPQRALPYCKEPYKRSYV